jgi:hypothetical protein
MFWNNGKDSFRCNADDEIRGSLHYAARYGCAAPVEMTVLREDNREPTTGNRQLGRDNWEETIWN